MFLEQWSRNFQWKNTRKKLIAFLETHPIIEKPIYISSSECVDILGVSSLGQAIDMKLTEEDKLYLFESLKVANIDGYTMDDVKNIIRNKFELLNTEDHAKTWRYDVDKIYLLLNSAKTSKPTYLYKSFVERYLRAFTSENTEMRSYCNELLMAIKNNENVLEKMNQEQKEKFLKLGPKNMNFMNQYFIKRSSLDKEIDVKTSVCSFLAPLTIPQVELLGTFSANKFGDLLNHSTHYSSIHNLAFCLYDEEFFQKEETTIDYDKLFSTMKYFPRYFLESLYNKTTRVQKSFVDYAQELNGPTLISCNHSLSYVPEEYREKISDFVIQNEDFRCLSAKKMELIFLELFNAYRKDDNICYVECLEFLIPFASEVSPKVLELTTNFLCHENDKEILDAKIEAIEKVREEIILGNSTLDEENNCYELYLKLLTPSDQLSKKKQIKQLKARSSYFENHQLESVLLDLYEDSERYESLQRLLNNHTGKKHHNQSYRFMEMANLYQDGVVDDVIQQLENVSSGKKAKQIIDYITQESFIEAPYEEKRNQLKNLPGQMLVLEQDDIAVDICDITSISKNKEVIFTNKETGAKVKVRRSNNKK